jgi:hypothetical protein
MNRCKRLCFVLATILVGACGKPARKSASYTVHVYNSTSDTLTIESPGEILSERQMKDPTYTDEVKREMTMARRAVLRPKESTTVYITQVRPFEIKVLEPASRTGLSHTIHPESTSKSLVLDLGAQGRFHLAPYFYKTLPNSHKPVPPAFVAQHRPRALPGPQMILELDKEYDGINAPPKKDFLIPKDSAGFAVDFVLVDGAGLQRALQTAH